MCPACNTSKMDWSCCMPSSELVLPYQPYLTLLCYGIKSYGLYRIKPMVSTWPSGSNLTSGTLPWISGHLWRGGKLDWVAIAPWCHFVLSFIVFKGLYLTSQGREGNHLLAPQGKDCELGGMVLPVHKDTLNFPNCQVFIYLSVGKLVLLNQKWSHILGWSLLPSLQY